MRRGWLVVAGAWMLAGCATAGVPVAEHDDLIAATVLALDGDGTAPGAYAAISTTPINPGAFASWFGQGEAADEVADTVPPGSAYVAVSASTGCRAPTGVEVSRNGADLVVGFTGGEDHEECYRPVGPVAYLAVPPAAVEGVRTVNGERPVAPAGPGELLGNLSLGTGQLEPVVPAELGTDAAEALRAHLIAARPGLAAEVTTALGRTTREGTRVFAFVGRACEGAGAVLLLGHEHVTAEWTGPAGCKGYFLAAFAVAADDVPEGATLSG
jgi:hypothetical protein